MSIGLAITCASTSILRDGCPSSGLRVGRLLFPPSFLRNLYVPWTAAGPGFPLLMLSHPKGLLDQLIESQRGEGVVTQAAGGRGAQ